MGMDFSMRTPSGKYIGDISCSGNMDWLVWSQAMGESIRALHDKSGIEVVAALTDAKETILGGMDEALELFKEVESEGHHFTDDQQRRDYIERGVELLDELIDMARTCPNAPFVVG